MAKADQRYGQRDGSDQNFDYMFKLLIIGNSSVGKTSFLFRYADDSFSNSFVSTVGIDFKVKTVYRNDKRIKLQIWVRTGKEPCVGWEEFQNGSVHVEWEDLQGGSGCTFNWMS
ncbi:Ras- protein Rab-3A [Ilyodon furcidens]|uniref:small monomeric GTPase n=1 Tax=Ilyodon furcidens TaxID=33524 RepID=A0ABV0TX03_9TELE